MWRQLKKTAVTQQKHEVFIVSKEVNYECGIRFSFALTLFTLEMISIANEAGETPLDIAKRLRHKECEELVRIHSEADQSHFQKTKL